MARGGGGIERRRGRRHAGEVDKDYADELPIRSAKDARSMPIIDFFSASTCQVPRSSSSRQHGIVFEIGEAVLECPMGSLKTGKGARGGHVSTAGSPYSTLPSNNM